MWPRIIIFESKILILEIEDVLNVRVEPHCRQMAWFARKLQLHLLYMVEIYVRVACGMDEVAWLQSRNLRHHHQQQGIRRDVERYAEKRIGTALVKLQAQAAVGHVKLEQAVARRQMQPLYVGHVTCAD